MPERAGRIDQHAVLEPDKLCAGCGRDQAKIVGRHDDRGAEPVHCGQQVKDALGHGCVDVAGRLVGND